MCGCIAKIENGGEKPKKMGGKMATKKVDHLRTQTSFPKLQNIALSYSNECG